jgi:hypothetical protein
MVVFRWDGTGRQPTVQFRPEETEIVAATVPSASLELPCVVRGSRLVVEKLVCYEGDFWEDGTDRYVTDVMALVVHNPGNTTIRRAELSVSQGERQLLFVITYLPPNSRVLVLERNQCGFAAESLTGCRCIGLEEQSVEPQTDIRLENAGIRNLWLYNDAEFPQQITLHYKRFDTEQGVYLGGITYQLAVGPIAPGKQRNVSPLRYVQGFFKVVLLEATPSGM